MQNLEKLQSLAEALPKGALKTNAVALVEKMGEVIEGFGDTPVEYRPETLKLVQATSDRSKLPKGTNIGALVLGEVLLEQPFKVIPLRTFYTRQYWDPDPNNARMLCNSPDGTTGYQYGDCKVCPYSAFDTENNRSQCNKTLTVLCVSADLSKVFFVNFSKTNYALGNDWFSLMKKAGVSPYKRIYEMSTETSKKSKNVEVLKAEGVTGERVEGEVLAFVEELFKVSGEDRKVSLERFYELVKARKARGDTAALTAADDVALLTTTPGDEDDSVVAAATVVVSAEEVASSESMAAKYTI